MKQNNIPIFFACDDNYFDYLLVTLSSLKEHANSAYHYDIKILYDRLSLTNKKRVKIFCQENITIQFVNVSLRAMRLGNNLGVRDYYTKTTYFRLLLANLYPHLDKVLYLDCDLVILEDVANLYHTEIGDNLLGGSPDYSINTYEEFGAYAENGLDIPKSRYINAGVLIMNLKAMRDSNFEKRVINLISAVTFTAAQDQDILNVMCRNKIHYLPFSWNTMPIGKMMKEPKIVHFALIFKPWRINDIRYEDCFWKYAKLGGVYDKIVARKGTVTPEQNEKELAQLQWLKDLCLSDSKRGAFFKEKIAYSQRTGEEVCHLQLNLQNID